MAQEYGAAQPIADVVDEYLVKPAKKVLGLVDKVPVPEKKTWQADPEDVRKATESFKTPPTLGQGKPPAKKKATKKRASKRM